MKKYLWTLFAIIFLFSIRAVDAQQQTFGGTRTNLLVEGHFGFVIEPTLPAPNGRKPWVWYAPTIGNYPNKSNIWLLERLVQNGFWICGIDVGESFGNPSGCEVFSMFYDTLMARYHLDSKACLIPQSRGGLMLYNWAVESGNSLKVSRIAGIYPVCDLLSYPGLSKAASAYGMVPDTFLSHIKEHNPVDRLQSLYEAGIRIFHIHGDNDVVVPINQNSQVIYDRYKALGGDATLIVVHGKGHEEIPEYFQSQEMLNFLLGELSQTQILHQTK
jgi:pimeloyl-ACP methyl ester carboxylesterase